MTLGRVTNVPNVAKNEKSGLVADIYSILARRWNHFCQVLNIRGFNDGRQTEIQQRFSCPRPVPLTFRWLRKS